MQVDQQRKSPHMAGSVNRIRLGGQRESNTGIGPFKDLATLLRHHASFVEIVLQAICTGSPISLAGRRALAFTVDRIRQCAEAINGR